MRLNSLEIKGFKSFADHTVIHFNEDITGIVGPNGSGKSNIVDAIRWVLGEQKSKELRLEKMSNVIFNGTKKRKQGGMAMVTLNFENTKNILPTEYQNVAITRVLYRSGESEYRLNGVTCRLKDITSLFLDTGIGSNSYAIIALSMVDDLISDKDHSRRKMFEQAAGISKYKIRKRETMNKLKNTTEDLDRIEDLLFEIENNLKQLEKQAKRTKRYYELKAKYKDLSITWAGIQLKEYKVKYADIKQKVEREEDKKRNIEIAIRKAEAQLEGEKTGNVDKEKALSERQREVNELLTEIRNREEEKKMLIQRQNYTEKEKVRLSEQIEAGIQRAQQLQQEIQSYQEKATSEKVVEQELGVKLEEAKQKRDDIRNQHGDIKAELDEFLAGQQSVEKRVYELEKQKAINSSQLENLKRELKQSVENAKKQKAQVKEIEDQLKDLESQIEKQNKLVDKLEKEESKRRDDIQKTELEREKLQKEMADLNRSLDAKRNEYNLTKSMVDNLEGFPESIRFLAKQKKWVEQAPLLSDLIYVKNDYRVAIENFLEPYLNYYVVKDLDHAREAIKLLSNSQKGKANFFVLSAFKNQMPSMSAIPNAQRAIDLVEVDPQYAPLVNHLLENVWITEKEDIPETLQDQDIVLLAKSGRYIQKKYSLRGGSVGLFEGKKIGRKKNLEVLDKAIKKLEREENKVATKYYSLKTRLEELKKGIQTKRIQQERNTLNKLSQKRVGLMTRLENNDSNLREAKSRQDRMEVTIQRLQSEIKNFDEQLKVERKALEEAKGKISEADSTFRQIAEQLSLASAAFNEQNIGFIQQQNKVKTFERELAFRKNQQTEAEQSNVRRKQALEKTGSETIEIEDKLLLLQEQLIADYKVKTEKETLLNEAEQNYFKARGIINELDDTLRNLNRQFLQNQTLTNELKDQFNELKLKLTSIGERLRIEFQVELNDIINNEVDESINTEELEQKVLKLRKRLENYGEINPMAVEAYDEMKVRYDTISEQRQDILEAKSSLLETIKEIEETATTQFMEAFDQVRQNFKTVFRSLFTESDDCDLTLSNPELPLESGIDIMAKPKGKRPQSINQLSGGEKTLTATALLFSLYLLKPAPFCIFDEVDAPLDDANIEKFNRIIRKFSNDSQFIIVTHNKQTMAAVDVIYGVFMQQQGISAVSAVDFRDLDHNAVLETEFVG